MKISKFIYAAVVGGVLASCQSVDTPMFSDKDAFVAFDSKSTSIAENAGFVGRFQRARRVGGF